MKKLSPSPLPSFPQFSWLPFEVLLEEILCLHTKVNISFLSFYRSSDEMSCVNPLKAEKRNSDSPTENCELRFLTG